MFSPSPGSFLSADRRARVFSEQAPRFARPRGLTAGQIERDLGLDQRQRMSIAPQVRAITDGTRLGQHPLHLVEPTLIREHQRTSEGAAKRAVRAAVGT